MNENLTSFREGDRVEVQGRAGVVTHVHRDGDVSVKMDDNGTTGTYLPTSVKHTNATYYRTRLSTNTKATKDPRSLCNTTPSKDYACLCAVYPNCARHGRKNER